MGGATQHGGVGTGSGSGKAVPSVRHRLRLPSDPVLIRSGAWLAAHLPLSTRARADLRRGEVSRAVTRQRTGVVATVVGSTGPGRNTQAADRQTQRECQGHVGWGRGTRSVWRFFLWGKAFRTIHHGSSLSRRRPAGAPTIEIDPHAIYRSSRGGGKRKKKYIKYIYI